MQLSRLTSLSRKSQISIAAVVVLVLLLTVTVNLTQQQQEDRSRASGADTVLYSKASYATTKTYAWADDASLGSIPASSGDQFAQADVSGLIDKDHAAGFRFRYGSASSNILVRYTGTNWQIEPGNSIPVITGAYSFGSSGKMRVEVSGSTIKAYWNSALVTTYTMTSSYSGSGVVPSIWQSSTGVTMSNIQAGLIGVAATSTPVPTAVPPTATKAPTLAPTATNAPTPTIGLVITPTKSPTPVPTAIPLVTATPFPTAVPSATPTPKPSVTLAPSATPVPGSTVASVKLFLHGIGKGGDSVNASSIGNTTPLHPQRTITFEVYDVQNQLVVTKQGPVSYNTTTGNFTGNIDLGADFNTGIYTVKIKTDKYLRGLVTGIQTITKGQINTLPSLTLVTGDINNDNQINIVDYNILIGCYSDLLPAVNCTDSNKDLSDLTDDNGVNQFDYNLFIRELTNIGGQ